MPTFTGKIMIKDMYDEVFILTKTGTWQFTKTAIQN